MKTRNYTLIILLVTGIAFVFAGCAAKKAAWGSLENGMIMKYQLNPDKELTYKSTHNFEQLMEINNQEISVTAEGNQTLLFKPLVTKSEDLTYEVTVTEMSSKIVSPRGEMVADLDEVIGKSFNFTFSRAGIELDFTGASDLKYKYGEVQEKSISSDVQTIIPDLPDHPVKPGDSWKSTDRIVEKTGSMEVKLVFDNVNTFEKLETYKGYECMKINVLFVGSLEGQGEEGGMDLVTTGKLGGSATWYYAYKEGIFVGNIAEGTGDTETVVSGPQEMTIPATRNFLMKTELQ